ACIRGARLAWREWGGVDEPPVIALHGWLDNAASFDALAPLLHGYRIIAPDLPGNGLSDHRGPEGSYNIWDDLPDLLAFLRALGIARCAVLGHSRGAFIGTLLAAIAPERVRSLALLDGLAPPPFDPADTVTQMRNFAEDYGLRETRGAKLYPDAERAIAARCHATGIDPRAAAMLVSRSLESCEGGLRWRTDGRLRYASAQKLGEPHLRVALGSVRAPALLLLAEGMISDRTAHSGMIDWLPGLGVESIPGCHHWHMLDAAPAIAARLSEFWSTHEH
ncbi:MAG: alpha/beta fold hydrolase, partial [Gammaproteobacteria bacterium]